MSEPVAYLNGQWIPFRDLSIPVYDAGFVLGTTVTEQLRTFRGRLFRLERHLARLVRSLDIVGIDPNLSSSDLAQIAQELADRNHRLLADENDDLGLAIFVTPGPYPTLASELAAEPTICMHTYPLPFGQWAEKYEIGQRLVTPDVRQVSSHCWPRELKCRSRMHYYLADNAAKMVDPESRALLLDEEGWVTETTTASLIVFEREEGIISPPHDKILPGISVAVVAELAQQLRIPIAERDLRPADVAGAEEVMLASTTSCLLPVVVLNGKAIGSSKPGEVFDRLLSAWSRMVGLDVAGQARRFAQR